MSDRQEKPARHPQSACSLSECAAIAAMVCGVGGAGIESAAAKHYGVPRWVVRAIRKGQRLR